METERKFLMKDFPECEGLKLITQSEVHQGYLSAKSPTVRIRSRKSEEGTDYFLNCKGRGTLSREEVELPISKEEFDRLCALLPIAPVKKDYRVYLLPGGKKLECSWVDRGTSSQFCYAEVEFSSIEEADAFTPPSFLGFDVTEEPYYAMSSYWSRKLIPVIL